MRTVGNLNGRAGFTLVELVVALFLGGLAVAGIYRSYVLYSTAYDVQEQVLELQQNLRAAMERMIRDIRVAAYDPTGEAGASIVTAGADSITFSMDRNNAADEFEADGDIDDSEEYITYSAYDIDGDGVNELVRNDVNGAGNQSIIKNVDALNFVYLDEDGGVTAVNADIRSVQISLVVRTTNEDYSYTNDKSYQNLQGTEILAVQNDNFRRRRLAAEVVCRNQGL